MKNQNNSLSANPNKENIFRAIMSSDSKNHWRRSVKTVFFKENVNLRFEEIRLDENFYEDWANKHPDPNAVKYYYDLYYGSTIIKRFLLVGVDGSRALLPPPKTSKDLIVYSLDYKVAQIHDRSGNLEEYMKRSGLKREI